MQCDIIQYKKEVCLNSTVYGLDIKGNYYFKRQFPWEEKDQNLGQGFKINKKMQNASNCMAKF